MKKIKILLSLLFFYIISITNINSQVYVNVGPSGDYADLTAFINNIKSYSDQTVIARIEPGTYTGQYIIDSIGYPGYPAQLNIEPQTTSPTFEAESGLTLSNNYVFLIRNSIYVTINNINFVNNNTLYSNVITFDHYVDYIDIYNCNFTNTSSDGVDTNKSIIYFTPTAGSTNIYIIENNFNNGSYGIYSNGAAIDLKIINNNFNDFDFCGIHLGKPNFSTINENIIVSTKATGNQSGIEVDIISPIHIRRNFIGLSGNTTNIGIACANSDSAIIANNMISLDGGGSNQALQIYNSYTDVVFNSIYIPYGNNNSIGLKLSNCDGTSLVQNNIFDVYAGYVFDFDQSVFSDFNIFNFNPSNNFAKFNSGIVADLNDWQNNYFMDYESLLGDPKYMSSTDLHTGNQILVEGKGIYLNGYDKDFDGQIRKNPPDIGADEIQAALSGTISSNTTWNKYVYIGDTITIEAGVVLTINPGTKISFADSALINNYGTINAIGKKDSTIIFAYYDNAGQKTGMPPAWKGIKNVNTPTNRFEYCEFSHSIDGALYFDNCSGSDIINCFFIDNNGQNGSAIFSLNSDITIRNCDFFYNIANNSGGALYLTDATTVENCVFSNNYSDLAGDIFLSLDASQIINNTFYNSSSASGAKSINTNASLSTIANSIFWGEYSNDTIISIQGANHPVMRNLNIFNAQSFGLYFESSYDTLNIYDFDPVFVDKYSGNFRLSPTSKLINKGNISYGYETDKDGNPRPYDAGIPDIGAYELQANPIFADAGIDQQICSNSLTLSANNPAPFAGTWSVIAGQANFEDIHDPNTKITNLGFDVTQLRWTVSNGSFEIYDDVIITNNQREARAFEDIYLISNNYPVLITQAGLLAQDPTPYLGNWTCTDGSVVIATPSNMITNVDNLKRGENVFIWSVNNQGCINTDTLIVSSGYGVIPLTQDSVGWSDPTVWNIGEIPGPGDSVNLTGAKVVIGGAGAICGKLFVSSATTLYLKGTAKSPAVLHSDKIYIEQNPEKKFKGGDTARLIINNGQIFINDATNELSDGLVIGSQGIVKIEPDAGGVAEIHLGKNRQLRIEAQAIFKGATGTGVLSVKNGGKIYIEQNAEKKNIKGFENNVYVGSGGTIYIEQNAEKKVSGNSELVVGAGNRIYIEQNAEKKGYEGGTIIINGGKIYVEQNAEKKGSFHEVNIHRGGKIYIEQNAEKKYIDSSVLVAPRILIDNGQLIVGSNVMAKAKTSKVRGNKIYIEQNAEKSAIINDAIVINGSGEIKINSSKNIVGGIYLGDYNTMTIAPSGSLVFADSSHLTYQKNASVIDYAYNNIPAVEIYSFNASDTLILSLPFNSVIANTINPSFDLYSWNESNNTFNLLNSSSVITGGSANKLITNPIPSTQYFSGTLNTGDISAPLNMTNEGINLIGNPYPSIFDFDKISLTKDVQSSIYIFNPNTNNLDIIQQNGLILGATNSLVNQNQGFFVITKNNSNFDFTSASQTHYVSKSVPSLNNISFRFSTNLMFSDNLGLIFKNNSTNNYSNKEDAIEIESVIKSNYINSYTYSADNKKLAINSRQVPADESTISIYLKSDLTGQFEFYMNQKNLSAGVDVFLINPETSDTTDLQSNQYYYFDYNYPNVEKEFILLFKGQMVDINEDIVQANIYSYNKDVYVNSSSQINKVEIYSITGVKIIDKNINSDKAIIKTNLEKGIYIVKAYLNGGIETKKIVIN